MIVKITTLKGNERGERAAAYVDTAYVVSIEPASFLESTPRMVHTLHGSKIHLVTGAIIESIQNPDYLAAKIWPEPAPSAE